MSVQLDLLGHACAKATKQLSAEVRNIVDASIKRAVDHADRDSPDWQKRALGYVREFIARNRDVFMAEQVRHYAEAKGFPVPADRRAWGSAMRSAGRAGLIRRAGYGVHADPKSHAGPATLWARVL